MASRWMPLSSDFVAYLLDGGTMRLPGNMMLGGEGITADDSDSDDVDGDDDSDGQQQQQQQWEGQEQEQQQWEEESADLCFEEVQQFVRDCLESYDGAVFPKLNWSSPKDAVYMVPHTSTRCTSVADVFLLLKSSDFVTHDLERAYEGAERGGEVRSEDNGEEENGPVEHVLVLREHFDIQTATEFRCFVRHGQLVAMCQRDCANFYPSLVERRHHFESLLVEFWEEHVRDRFPLRDYVVDLYVSRKDVVWVIDFNVYGPPTQSLMFEWDELERLVPASLENGPESAVPRLRIVTDQSSVPFRPPLSMYSGLPTDLVDVSNAEKINQWIREQQDQKGNPGLPDV